MWELFGDSDQQFRKRRHRCRPGRYCPDYSSWRADLLPSGQWGPLQPFGSPSVGLRQLDFALDIDLRAHAFAVDPERLHLAHVPDHSRNLAAVAPT